MRAGRRAGASVTHFPKAVGSLQHPIRKRILDGDRKLPAKPIPIERLKITVNLKTARFLGIEFPKDVNHLIDETY